MNKIIVNKIVLVVVIIIISILYWHSRFYVIINLQVCKMCHVWDNRKLKSTI